MTGSFRYDRAHVTALAADSFCMTDLLQRLGADNTPCDWLHNRLGNLRFLCPNCHAQTSTWCRKKSARPA